MGYIPESTLAKARTLRRDPTPAERALWHLLRNRQVGGFKFRRQHPVPPYVLDFACLEVRVAVECDGERHAGSPRDAQRKVYLEAQGWRVLRFWNHEVLENPEGVAETILAILSSR
jgi:very-short-patch-repair endonuclease